ncbi:zinc finger and BTB domain-containing protein 42-like isoform X1 [Harmonia axyridis]|uniref:zinc finger and BTB domain-containing protein 42-like isoform X1 n=1 Tax=Harmonia axyridis TaxID=115357 RepID=UPI001E278760|nr:zinc finger and BTB domain-containing protein 42-like isoform X1 [Harmonia axyridis]
MEGEQFSLCWNNFHHNLSSGFHALYKEEDLVDVTLAAEGKYIKAHKTVLSVCSPYFKELFRINPCKHPIVILQDVNYTALCSLLQFMYQGQVSVGQEEIPTFMRVAETLRVKGLTDNGSPNLDTNGMNSFSDQKNMMKKPMKPVKKVIRPIQPLQRPNSSPIQRAVKSPLPSSSTPPAKKMHLEEQLVQKPFEQLTQKPLQQIQKSIPNTQQPLQHSQVQNSSRHIEPLLKPKMEPIDHPDDDDSTQQSFDEEPFDMNALMAQSLETGDHSMESMPPGWISDNANPPDTSSPGGGRLFFLRSGKGHLVLIHNGHMYTLGKAKDNRYMWICVKKKSYSCDGCVVTMEGPMLVTHTVHNHPQLNDVIKRLQVPPITPMTALNLSKKSS